MLFIFIIDNNCSDQEDGRGRTSIVTSRYFINVIATIYRTIHLPHMSEFEGELSMDDSFLPD